ncbi:TRAP transporter small permease [Brevibacillus sp. TJ4]|uniref:TRAP transporter small permease n=1 Tax=Brevibacillus sp. TJ4 TaxID=3234853 RepID=UPI0037D4E92C
MGLVQTVIAKISHGCERVIRLFIQVSVGVLILDLNISVFFRYVLQEPIVGTQEIALVLLGWITFLGACLSVRNHSMVAVTFFVEKFGAYQVVARIASQLLIFGFSICFFIYGYLWVTSPSVLQITMPALQIPVWISYSIIPVSMLITMVFTIDNIVRLLAEWKGQANRPEQKQEAEM